MKSSVTSPPIDRARRLRGASTDAERVLWRHLRDRQLAGFKFRRQHPVAGYFLDLACVEAGLCVEVDGAQHLSNAGQAADEGRSGRLREAGFEVLRFDNRQVLTETHAVLGVIQEALLRRRDGFES